jgi:hypothetical protein
MTRVFVYGMWLMDNALKLFKDRAVEYVLLPSAQIVLCLSVEVMTELFGYGR